MVISGTFILAFVFSILAMHIAAIFYTWYHTFWWIDVLLHTLGGMWTAAVFFYGIRRYAPQVFDLPVLFVFIFAVGFTMLIGVGWEWFEYSFDFFVAADDFAWRAQRGLPDTMGDLVADFIGGGIMTAYILLIWRNLHSTAARRK